MRSKVLCIGELLWDMIPSGKEVGGAPFNVAYHLKKLGVQAHICTRVGIDKDGDVLVGFVVNQNMDTSLIQRDPVYPTSTVNVVYDNREGISYDIVKPVAWDFLEGINYELRPEDFVLYGSLVFRNDVSKQTVLTYIKNTCAIKVFDVNLRNPHYDKDTLFEVLALTDILKINEEELHVLLSWLGEEKDVFSGAELLLKEFNLQEIVCTRGGKGVYYCSSQHDERFIVNAVKIDVVDTIGSGDSFLAGYLKARIAQQTIKESLRFAVTLAGFVSSKKGGCPPYEVEEFKRFQFSKQLV